ncbi:methyl-accepting chemotaxis protein [Paenibacillus sp. MMS20-IR301]|uniref:methyl-accepting chemotaxis protein n=1 Tax=Paenibacillus sp. MMS20-IR301 TaxID=2895946 RepID=UPI0028E49856|nr:methyl-accepting chemotaxis protein [Paenibacillus sp. MMS20-IR301]WNS42569.1 methyl-accepting chemotaxis protein [Paenibacillus sp. MMS20-IR301]
MNKKARLSIRTKLILTYLLVLLAPSIIIGWLTYQSASGKVEEQLTRNALESVVAVNEIIDANIQAKIDDISYFAAQLSAEAINNEAAGGAAPDLKTRLKEYGELHSDVLDIYAGTSKGSSIRASDIQLPDGYDPRKENAYINALKAGSGVVISPVFQSVNNETAIAISMVLAGGNGVVGLDLNLSSLADLTDIKVGQQGYILIIDSSKKFLVHPVETIGQESTLDFVKQMFAGESGSFDYKYEDTDKKMTYMVNELTGWRIGGTISKSEVSSATEDIRQTVWLVISVSVLLALFLIYLNVSSILKPLVRLRRATEMISAGDLSQDIGNFASDEIGLLAENFRTMVGNLRQMIISVQEMTDNVSSSAEQLTAGAEQTTKAIEHVTTAIQEVASGTERQVSSVHRGMESTAATTSEVEHISEFMGQVSAMMDKTSLSASEGNESVISVVDKINGIHETVEELGGVIDRLNERTGQIQGIVGVITGISRQTNLLALNASIEAARAGEQGRGFAVVASEVRKLAEESEKSAKMISEQISSIRTEMVQATATMEYAKNRVSEGIMAVDTTGRSFSRIRRAVKGAAEKIEAMNGAVHTLTQEADSMDKAILEIRGITQEAAGNTETISAAAQQQLASVEEIASSTADLSHLADELQRLVGRFKLYTDKQ